MCGYQGSCKYACLLVAPPPRSIPNERPLLGSKLGSCYGLYQAH